MDITGPRTKASKIIDAINSMVINRDEIRDAILFKGECLFNFNGYVWSIKSLNDEAPDYASYLLSYYPGCTSVAGLSTVLDRGETVTTMRYYSDSFKTREAIESFEALHRTAMERLYDIDNVLDDIISLSYKKKRYSD